MSGRIILLVLCCLAVGSSWAQDPHFSQFMDAPLWRNPALAGIFEGDYRLQAVYRNQWSTINKAYQTGSFNAEYRHPIAGSSDFFTYGLQAVYDKAGTAALTTTHLLPAVNFNKSMSENSRQYLSLAFMGGLVQRRIDRSKITTDNTYDYGWDGETNLYNQYSYLDGSVGLSYNANFANMDQDNYYLGVAYHHFNKPKNRFFAATKDELNPRTVFSGGITWASSEISTVKIEADYEKQGTFSQVRASVLYSYLFGQYYSDPDYVLYGGVMFRSGDAVAPIIKLYYRPVTVSFSFDINHSRLRPASNGYGAAELSMVYTGFFDQFKGVIDRTKCPKF